MLRTSNPMPFLRSISSPMAACVNSANGSAMRSGVVSVIARRMAGS